MTSVPHHLAGAYAHCAGIARRHYENFPVASVLIPKRLRPHVCAVYAFARRADDFADEARFSGRRTARIGAWERQFKQAIAGHTHNPVLAAVAHTVHAFDLPETPFFDLLSAFRQDVTVSRYQNFEQVQDYCRRSADPVGRIILMLFGYRQERYMDWSDAICTALQLANFWQDVAVDAKKDRIYLPTDDMARFGVTENDVLNGHMSDAFRDLMAFQVSRTRALFQDGRPLCTSVSGRLAFELKAIWLGGMGILDAVERSDYNVLAARPAHGTSDRLRFLSAALVPGQFNRVYRPRHAHA